MKNSPPPGIIRTALLGVGLLLFFGCSPGPSPRELSLITTEEEVLLWTHDYNTSQDHYKIIPRYLPEEEFSRLPLREFPDLLITRYRLDLKTSEKNRILPLEEDDPEGGIPLSYDLPVIVYSPEPGRKTAPAMTITLQEMADRGVRANRRNNTRFTQMGFVPTWQDIFLTTYLDLKEVNFSAPDQGGPIEWDHQKLTAALEELKSWIDKNNGGYQEEEAFINRYLYDPPEKLLAEGRIAFFTTTLQAYRELPMDLRRNFAMAYPMENGRIPCRKNVLTLRAFNNKGSRRGSRDFTQWILKPETQEMIIQEKTAENLPRFGLAGGLSTSEEVNQRILPRLYPDMAGLIPQQAYSPLPKEAPPAYWAEMRETVLLPWIRRTLSQSGEALPEATELKESLSKALDNWIRSNLAQGQE